MVICNNCDKKNIDGSKYCKYCGEKISKKTISNAEPKLDKSTYISDNEKPYPYVISTIKLIVMSLFTFGIYDIYWFYKHWKSFNYKNEKKKSTLELALYSFFSVFTSYFLFSEVSPNIKKVNHGRGLENGALAFLYMILSRFFLGFIPLLIVQSKINRYWEEKYSNNLVRSKFGLGNLMVVIVSIILMLIAFSTEDIESTDIDNNSNKASINNIDFIDDDSIKDEIASSVVNIYCPNYLDPEAGSGGSGTIISEEGIIITNSHIIPQDEDEIFVDEVGCIVTLPDPKTGQPAEIYLADPFVLNDISDEYDLAFLFIYDAYYDEDEDVYWGEYPKVFPTFDDTERCVDEYMELGEEITIYGYPSLSGGISLTLTDGLISSFPGDGLVVTSANISEGNSGGLAVDKNGCFVGVPSMVSYDDSESLGVIISSELVDEFSTRVLELIDEEVNNSDY